MGRTAKNKTKAVKNIQTSKAKKKVKTTRWEFEIGDKVYYVGGIYSEYKNKEVTILSKDGKNHRNDYVIQYENDEPVMIPEKGLKKIKIESEVAENTKET